MSIPRLPCNDQVSNPMALYGGETNFSDGERSMFQ